LLVGILRLSFQITTAIIATATAVVTATARGVTTTSRSLTAIGDVFFLNGSTCTLVNLLPTDLGSKFLTALGYAALLAKNFTLTNAPRRLLPLLAVSILL
jgi:hypothetical protein